MAEQKSASGASAGAEVYEAWEGYTGIRDHLQLAKGVADTNPHTRDFVERLEKLLGEVERKIKPLESKLQKARQR